MDHPVQLVEPCESAREEFIAYCEEFRDAGEGIALDPLPEAQADFAGLVRKWAQHARGENLPEGAVPQSAYWFVRGGRIVGTARFRHCLNESNSQEGGPIG